MASLNTTQIIGNLGRDPEVRYTPNGTPVANLRIATTRGWKDKESGEKFEETEWHAVVLYGRQAEVAGEYLKKGRPVFIQGRLRTRKWQDKDGVDRYNTEIIAEDMQMLGDKPAADKPEPAQSAPVAGKPAAKKASGTSSKKSDDDMSPLPPIDDDSIPF